MGRCTKSNTMNIKEEALKLKAEYDAKYLQWCKDNPGYIMNGLSSKSMCMDEAKHCDTLEELEVYLKIIVGRAKERDLTKQPHGFNFYVAALKELMEIIKTK